MSRLKGRLILYKMLVYSRSELRESREQLAKGFAEYEHGYIKSPSQERRLRELRRYNVEGTHSLDKRGLKSKKRLGKRLTTAVLQLF